MPLLLQVASSKDDGKTEFLFFFGFSLGRLFFAVVCTWQPILKEEVQVSKK